jgi:hypothetical protein
MAATPSGPQSQDILFTVQGYVTDPKLVGYQILTNYESMYWAPLVGSDAWRLYEVLRSFCHEGNNICYPSIKLLTNILGFKDKRSLIGRVKRVDGKEYQYPGLIEILQNYNLIVAEVTGEEPQVKYVFHVNLTPGLLTDEQLYSLPKLLQQKHDQLLERCQQTQEELDSKKRAQRFPEKQPQNEQNGGGGKFPPPVGISHAPGGNFPPEQHQHNNTHKTIASASEDHNNNSGGETDPEKDVVVALLDHGISQKVAQRLASRYSKERVLQKIEYLDYLVAETPDKVQKPAAWLRRAIEENYSEPDGYVSKEDRERLTAEAAQQAEEEERHIAAAEERQKNLQEKKQAQNAARIDALRDEYGTTEEDLELWEKAQTELKYTATPEINALVPELEILNVRDGTVLLGAWTEATWRRLQHPGTAKVVERSVGQVVGKSVELQVLEIKLSPISTQ